MALKKGKTPTTEICLSAIEPCNSSTVKLSGVKPMRPFTVKISGKATLRIAALSRVTIPFASKSLIFKPSFISNLPVAERTTSPSPLTHSMVF